MIEYSQAKLFIESCPWPQGTRPLLSLSHEVVTRNGAMAFVARLYRPEETFEDVVQIAGPTPEGALRIALGSWVANYALPPRLIDAFARLLN